MTACPSQRPLDGFGGGKQAALGFSTGNLSEEVRPGAKLPQYPAQSWDELSMAKAV